VVVTLKKHLRNLKIITNVNVKRANRQKSLAKRINTRVLIQSGLALFLLSFLLNKWGQDSFRRNYCLKMKDLGMGFVGTIPSELTCALIHEELTHFIMGFQLEKMVSNFVRKTLI
jgi:hypothetical protein